MRLIILAIRDIKADCFGAPNFVVSKGSAVRGFADEINRAAENNMLYKHPDDFEMYQLGYYDDATAKFELFDRPEQIAVGGSFAVREPDGLKLVKGG